MKTKLKQVSFILTLTIFAVVLMAWKEYDPGPITPACEDLVARDGKISVNFNAGANIYRKSGQEFYVPSPDMRYGDNPGQDILDQTKFTCTVNVTSPNCSSFQWNKSFENPSNVLNIKLPPSGYDATIKITYVERGEDFSTIDFNKPAFDMFGNSMNYSRVKYQHQMTYIGWPSGNVAQPIFLNPTENEGYNVDPATGKIQTPPAGGKTDFSDLSGINVFIELGN